MIARTSVGEHVGTALVLITLLGGIVAVCGQQTGRSQSASTEAAGEKVSLSSAEQGHTSLDEAFDWSAWRLEKRRKALEDTKVTVDLRTMYMDRNKFDGSESEAWAVGGWSGVKTGCFLDHVALGLTGYTSQPLYAPDDEFVSMSVDAGATAERGVFAVGGLYQKGDFSFGAIDYYCADVINIVYAEARVECPIGDDLRLRLAAQCTDQRSVGDALLPGGDFSARQFGHKAELPVGRALCSVAYTSVGGDANMQNPWSGYPGYTGGQVQDFYREGESAVLLRAAHDFAAVKGHSTYALAVFGSEPDAPGEYRQDEYDLNLQWAAYEGTIKGLSLAHTLRVRPAAWRKRG